MSFQVFLYLIYPGAVILEIEFHFFVVNVAREWVKPFQPGPFGRGGVETSRRFGKSAPGAPQKKER